MITVKCEMDLIRDTWAGGRKAAELYLKWGLLDEVENIIADWVSCCDEEATDTTINDILWFKDDFIAQSLGYESYEALYNKMEHEEEEE